MEEITIDIGNFKGIKNINKNFKISEKVSSLLIYAPNGTGKTSLVNAFKDRHQTPNAPKKNKVSGEKYKVSISRSSGKGFSVFDSFDDIENFGVYKMFLSTITQEEKVAKAIKNIKEILNENPEIEGLLYNESSYKNALNKEKFLGLRENSNILLYKILFKNNLTKDVFDKIKEYIKENKKIIKKTKLKLGNEEISALIKLKRKKDFNILSNDFKKDFSLNYLIDTKEEIKRKKENNKKRFKDLKIDLNLIDEYQDYLSNIKFNKLLKFKVEVKKYIFNKYEKEITEILKSISDYEDEISKDNNKKNENFNFVKNEYEEIFPNSPIEFNLKEREDKYLGYNIYNLEIKVNSLEANNSKEGKVLLKEVSLSEKRSIYIFSIINKIKKEIDSGKSNLFLVFDDIIDSFDEINQISFMYYLKKLENKKINFIVLTHNYTFYKVLSYKLNKNKSLLMTKYNDSISILDDKALAIEERGKKSNIRLFDFLYSKNYLKKYKKIALILSCVTREMLSIGFFYNIDKEERKMIENEILKFLHFKKETSTLLFYDYISIFDKHLIGDNIEIKYLYSNKSYLSVLLEEAGLILKDDQDNLNKKNIYFMLIDKIILAISIRILLEKKIIDFLEEGFKILEEKRGEPQTTFLIKKLNEKTKKRIIFKINNEKYKLNTVDSKFYFKSTYLLNRLNGKISEKSNLVKFDIASANIIHLNSLRHEALFYYDINHLKILYKEILENNLIDFLRK